MMTIDELEYGHKRWHLEDMEKEIYFDKYQVIYSGYFSYNDFIKMVNKWCRDNGYYREMKSSGEKVTEKGTTKSLDLQLQKKISPTHLSVLNVDIDFSGMTEETKEMDGRMMAINKGDVEITFHGYLMTSRKARWETKGYVYFIRMVIDKFVYKLDKPKFRGTVVNDGTNLAKEMRGLLNSYKGRVKE